jgi:4-amino-4-deoxy-L-arabinose transferase-like glycosyltransferase
MTVDQRAKFDGILRLPASGALIIILLWAAASLPNITLHSFIWEEGNNASIARQILTGKDAFPPVIYGVRMIDKPYLLAWLAAAVAMVTGEVSEWSARIPAMASVLLTALLVRSVTARYASWGASLFAGLAFLFSPMLLQKLRIAEPDTFVCFLSLGAFVVWWNGAEVNRVTIWRWVGCGCILALLALLKGPMPVGFFALGVAAYEVLHRRWQDFLGLFICLAIPAVMTIAWGLRIYQPGDEKLWLLIHGLSSQPTLAEFVVRFSRQLLILSVELIPAILLLPFVPWPWRSGEIAVPVPPIVAPLILYSVVFAGIIVMSPKFNGRYAMPITATVAILGGIGWDALKEKSIRMRWIAGAIATLLITYQLALVCLVIPMFSDRFGESRLDGEAIGRAIRAAPAPAFCLDPASNQLFYVRMPVRCIEPAELRSFSAPAWLLIPQDDLSQIVSLRQDLKFDTVVTTTSGPGLLAVRVEKR